MVFISSESTMLDKLRRQSNSQIVFADIDGTLFTPGPQIVKAPFYNMKTVSYLSTHAIPLVLVTGRSDFVDIDKIQTQLLGITRPDAVITACGSVIYERQNNGSYARDLVWESQMHYTKVKANDGKIETWNKLDITQKAIDFLKYHHIHFRLGKGNTFEIRIKVSKIPTEQLEEIRKGILSIFPQGILVLFTEKLLWPNTLDTFSGDILILPKNAGKENAIKYLLDKIRKQLQSSSQFSVVGSQMNGIQPSVSQSGKQKIENRIIHAFIFGDATVDVGMLSMKLPPEHYSLSQYLVHPTPLSRKAITAKMKSNENLHILEGDGPEVIWKVVSGQALSVKREALSQEPSQQGGENVQPNLSSRVKQFNNVTMQQSPLSPAQNNPARKIIRKLEPLLDRIVDKNLTPNEVSFLGLRKLSEGLDELYGKDVSLLGKIKGWYYYSFGQLTDVLDGVRARQRKIQHPRGGQNQQHIHTSGVKTNLIIPGQLVDGFSDRAKEFMQLYIRACKRIEPHPRGGQNQQHIHTSGVNENIGLKTFLTALSCSLPSIARAQVEITGQAVPERDEKGGSMIDRTKKLFTSLLMDIIDAHNKSTAIDQKIYSTNLSTYYHRLSYTKVPIAKILQIRPDTLSPFQKEALERWLLYIDVLQQEDNIMKNYLSSYPTLLKAYERDSQKLAKDYLKLPIGQLRRKWKIPDYHLRIKDYIF